MLWRVLFALLLLPNFLYAEDGHLVINRFQIAGATSTGEFVEISNPTSSSVNLSGWRLSKKTSGGSIYNLLTSFPEMIIAPGNSIVVAHKDYSGGSDILYSTSNSLAPDNTILLFSDSGKTLVDRVGFGKAGDYEGAPAPSPAANQILSRTDYKDTQNNQADFQDNQIPETPTLSDTFFDLRITELMPNPEGTDTGKEWVEIYNAGERVDLGGLILSDKKGSIKKYIFPLGTYIDKNSYFLVNSQISGISLNNDGDLVEIQSPFGAVVDSTEIDYETAKEGYSFSLQNNEWFWTKVPTPGSQNVIQIDPSQEKASTKSTAKKSKKPTPKKSTKTPKKKGEVLGAVDENPFFSEEEAAKQSKNDRLFGLILIAVALIGGLLYTLYINKEKLIAVYNGERKKYDKSWQRLREKIKRR